MAKTLYFKWISEKLKKNKLAMSSGIFLALLTILAIMIPFLSPYNYYSHDLDNAFLAPFSKGHIFGTDEFGRDIFVRVFEGARISFTIGISAAVLQSFIGVLYGGLAGILGRKTDELMMRAADILYSIPYLILVMLMTMVLGRGVPVIILALAVTDWTAMARIVRVEVLRLKKMEFVEAARVLGVGRMRILIRHILPNCMDPIIVNLTFSIPSAIFSESFLGFVGLGVQVPRASLGSLASDGYKHIMSYPWMVFIPLAVIIAAMIAFNILGDALRDSMDSRA